jgi:hypothetical protein
MEHGCYPRFFPTGTRLPHGVRDEPSLFLQRPNSGGDGRRRGIFQKTRAGRDHSTGSVDPSLRPPMEKRREGPASDMPKNTRNLVVGRTEVW